ncbi:molybdate ABC transporter substrate-binding protein [Chlorobium limicola]|uniref:Molybdenum ABC transporter substrate-binding protein n=1 Tax=Chlorobium limicola TaxID=1092 RepID=A0A117MSG7_CHLLI|nr:molybdate ABC transporter substrate-binding protein [Chlorobium limicola]KUL33279.1 molybdenum ABC transporter substrate-binding protein [Chlorobium limicola]
MNQKKTIIFLLFLLAAIPGLLQAETLTVAAGAGYKRPLMEIAALYEKKTGHHIDAVFGNMQQIFSQTETSGKVSVVFGEKSFLNRSTLSFSSFHPVGKGTLVLAWRKGLELKRLEDIRKKEVRRLGIPDPEKAIYGHAAAEYLKKSGLSKKTEQKLITLSTVPQVSAYLVSGEIDAGFINITDAIGIREKNGGMLPVPRDHYSPIDIQAAVVNGFEKKKEVTDFLRFLKQRESLAVLKHYGI